MELPRRGRDAASGLRDPVEQPVHEAFAERHLVEGDELVRLVRLIDAPRAAHHRRHAALLKQPRLGAEGDPFPVVEVEADEFDVMEYAPAVAVALGGIAVLFLVAAATVATIVSATRSAMASRNTIPNPSWREGRQNTSARAS